MRGAEGPTSQTHNTPLETFESMKHIVQNAVVLLALLTCGCYVQQEVQVRATNAFWRVSFIDKNGITQFHSGTGDGDVDLPDYVKCVQVEGGASGPGSMYLAARIARHGFLANDGQWVTAGEGLGGDAIDVCTEP